MELFNLLDYIVKIFLFYFMVKFVIEVKLMIIMIIIWLDCIFISISINNIKIIKFYAKLIFIIVSILNEKIFMCNLNDQILFLIIICLVMMKRLMELNHFL